MSPSRVDLSRTACVWVFPTEALLTGLAVAGFDDASVVVDPHLQVLGPQGSVMQLLQKIRHTWQKRNNNSNMHVENSNKQLEKNLFYHYSLWNNCLLAGPKYVNKCRVVTEKTLTTRHHPAHAIARKDGLGIVAVRQQVIESILWTQARRLKQWSGESEWS